MNKLQAMTPQATDTKLLISLMDSCSKAGAAYRARVSINGERYTLIDRRAQWRKKFDSANSKS